MKKPSKTTNTSTETSKEYSISLRLTRAEADRIKLITERTKQTISDFIRAGLSSHLDNEEIRMMEIDVRRKELQDKLKSK